MSNRSHAYASIDCYKEALSDAERVIELRPDWPKVLPSEIIISLVT